MREPPPGLLAPFTIQVSALLSQDMQITVALRGIRYSVDRVFVDREDAARRTQRATLDLFHVETVPAGHPRQRFFQDPLRQVATRLLAAAPPAHRAFLDDVQELPFALLHPRRLIREAVEGLRGRV